MGAFLARLVDAALEASVVGSFSSIGLRVRRRLGGWEELPPGAGAGRVVLVTGATSGIGLAAAEHLAALGATVRIVGRDEGRIARACESIERAGSGPPVRGYRADLSSRAEVDRLVAEITEGEPRLDALVHNAGMLLPERLTSRDGHELHLATMVLGPWRLTEGMLPLLAAGGGGRVVTVSSGGMYTQRLIVDDLESEGRYRGTVAYARAKRAQVVLTELWARRHGDTGVVFHAMHPGWVDTPGVRRSLPAFHRILRPLLRTPEEGADTLVWLCLAAEPGRRSGLFWHDRRPRGVHRLPGTRESEAERRRLWERLESGDRPEASHREPPRGGPRSSPGRG